MTTMKMTRQGFQRAFHAARRRYWGARAKLDMSMAQGAEEAACRLASAAQDAGLLTEDQEVMVSMLVVDMDAWLATEGL